MRTPNRTRYVSSRTYSDGPIPLKEYTTPLTMTSTEDNNFKIGELVIVPMRDKVTVSGIVKWMGEVKLSEEAFAITAVGVETVSNM